jgi:hypothetical protein
LFLNSTSSRAVKEGKKYRIKLLVMKLAKIDRNNRGTDQNSKTETKLPIVIPKNIAKVVDFLATKFFVFAKR